MDEVEFQAEPEGDSHGAHSVKDETLICPPKQRLPALQQENLTAAFYSTLPFTYIDDLFDGYTCTA